jgi:hypothetical protein
MCYEARETIEHVWEMKEKERKGRRETQNEHRREIG